MCFLLWNLTKYYLSFILCIYFFLLVVRFKEKPTKLYWKCTEWGTQICGEYGRHCSITEPHQGEFWRVSMVYHTSCPEDWWKATVRVTGWRHAYNGSPPLLWLCRPPPPRHGGTNGHWLVPAPPAHEGLGRVQGRGGAGAACRARDVRK